VTHPYNPHHPDWDKIAPDTIGLEEYARAWIDMAPHVPTLKALAAESKVIVEFGLRGAVSTWAMLEGLPPDGHLLGVDIDPNAPVPTRVRNDPRFNLVTGNSLEVDLPPTADLVMIDSSHEFTQTVLELARAATLRPRVIVCHDYLYAHTPQVKAAVDGFVMKGYLVEPEYRLAHVEASKWGLAVLERW
jgi:predicted O-methyltransferase YrrM